MKYYFLQMWGCVEPNLYGPYDTPEERDSEARAAFKANGGGAEHSYCKLDIDENGEPNVGSFINDELSEETISVHLYFTHEIDRTRAISLVEDHCHWVLNPRFCLTLTGTSSQVEAGIMSVAAKRISFVKNNTLKEE